MTDQTAGVLLIAGSLVFLVGAAVGVPGVFRERDPEVRLRMLDEHAGRWRLAQPLYGAGPVIVAAGVAHLASGAPDSSSRALFAAAAVALFAGAVAWAWSLWLRATRISDFAFGRLPAWPFASYVLLTIGGLALLGVGLLSADVPTWTGWLTLGAAGAFLAAYLRFGDIPPFVFYLVLIPVGAGLV